MISIPDFPQECDIYSYIGCAYCGVPMEIVR